MVICLEGIDGAGKSTVLREVAARIGGGAVAYSRCRKGRFAKRCLASPLARRSSVLQAIVYTSIAWRNYLTLDKRRSIVLMDRCAMSNVCYFFPRAVGSELLTRLLAVFEPPIRPGIILVLEVTPEVAWERCGREKDLNWLARTRDCYGHFIQIGRYCGSPVVGISKTGIEGRVEEVLSAINRCVSGDSAGH